jgi:CHASE3 domain sensor protein
LNFGVILATVVVLLAINLIAVQREHETKAAAQRSIDMTEATSSVRFQMMQNRLHLQNYLLSGDTRDVEKMTDGERQLNEALRRARGTFKFSATACQSRKSAGARARLG